MRLTQEEQLRDARLHLMILQSELQGYLDGLWVPEYHLTIGYNRVYTGRKRYVKTEE